LTGAQILSANRRFLSESLFIFRTPPERKGYLPSSCLHISLIAHVFSLVLPDTHHRAHQPATTSQLPPTTNNQQQQHSGNNHEQHKFGFHISLSFFGFFTDIFFHKHTKVCFMKRTHLSCQNSQEEEQAASMPNKRNLCRGRPLPSAKDTSTHHLRTETSQPLLSITMAHLHTNSRHHHHPISLIPLEW
jgi:hypothetical protein